MSLARWARIGLLTMTGAAMLAGPASIRMEAQSLGTFRWQIRPFCNLFTLTVRQDNGVYSLAGVDDQCGGTQQASLVGTAFPNPDGSIGLGVSGMTAPGAAPVVLQARIDLATVSGTWSDSAGNSGAFVFTPGTGVGGNPRPVPLNGIRAGSITSSQLAPGAIGAAQIALGAITSAQLADGSITGAKVADGSITAAKLAPGAAQPPIVGTCPPGQYLRGVNTGGLAICEPLFVAPAMATLAPGLYPSFTLNGAGHPVIAYYANSLFQTVVCDSPTCRGANVMQVQFNPGGTFSASSVAIGADGLPVVAYRNTATDALRVTKCGNPTCSSGNISTDVDNPVNVVVGGSSSMAVPADGRPVIAHLVSPGGRLRINKRGNAPCPAGNTSTTPELFVDALGETAMAIGADGLPIVAHFMNVGLRVIKCGNAACTAGTVATTVDPAPDGYGRFASIAIGVDGLPIISSQGGGNVLRVTHCGNAACSSGNVSRTIDDTGGNAGTRTALAIGDDGLPIISHVDDDTAAIRVVKCGDVACGAGNLRTTLVAGNVSPLGFPRLAIGADRLPILVYSTSAEGLRVVKCASRTCQ